jgi:hypothetical protein
MNEGVKLVKIEADVSAEEMMSATLSPEQMRC